jgi:DNA-binding NarL/FixJ family response regulator
MTSVAIVDDQELVRAGFRLIIESAGDLDVVGEAANGEEAVALVEQHGPDVVLMDVRMPVMDGIEATRRIGAGGSATRVIVLTTFDLDEYVHEALRAGASGFLLKDTPAATLLDAIRIVAQGEALLAPSVTRRLIERFASTPASNAPSPGSLDVLTEREREVLGLIARGLSNQEIADELVMSPATAKTHVSRIMTKLHARDRAGLVVLAYESGLVAPGSA